MQGELKRSPYTVNVQEVLFKLRYVKQIRLRRGYGTNGNEQLTFEKLKSTRLS